MFQPPTDNLYKFLAIAGISIIFFSIGFTGQKYVEFERMDLEFQGKIRIVEYEIDVSAKEVADLTSWQKKMGKKREETGKPIPREELAAFTKEHHRLAPIAYKNKEKVLESLSFAYQVAHLKKWLTIYAWVTAIGSIIGVIMSIFGFRLWYIKVQRYADVEMKANALPKYFQKKRR